MLRALPAGAVGPQLREQAAAIARQTARAGARIVVPEDDEWPAQLPDLASAPGIGLGAALCLWVRHDLPQPVSAVLGRAVAVVGGARRDQLRHARRRAARHRPGWRRLGRRVHRRARHRYRSPARRARRRRRGGRRAGGRHRPAHPHANSDLFDQVIRDGMLLSPWPPGTTPLRARYTATAALVATLTAGTVLVEAAADSRALNIVHHAICRDRPTMVVPGPVTSALSNGNHRALREHPQARLVRDAADVIAELADTPA